MKFGDSGFGYDVVNGLHRVDTTPMGSGPGGKIVNRDRLKRHEVDSTNRKIFWALAIVAIVLLVLFHRIVIAGIIIAALVYWMYWSGSDTTYEELCEIDPATGQWFPVDDRAKAMLGYGDMFETFIDKENKLIDVLASAKTLPPEMDDSTVNIECEEYDDAKTVFAITIAPVNGVVAFIKKTLPDIAGAFGDPDRWEFHKRGEDERGWSVWQLTVFDQPKNIKAGVAWE